MAAIAATFIIQSIMLSSFSTYSLLQVSLDQTIDRQSLEAASDTVSSVARADCAFILRDLFGIVVSGLSLGDARAFQIALNGHPNSTTFPGLSNGIASKTCPSSGWISFSDPRRPDCERQLQRRV